MSALRSAASRVAHLLRVRSGPVWFLEETLQLNGSKYYLDQWQKELVDSIADVYRKKVGEPTKINHEGKSMITVRAMHGPGKTFTIAAVMHWFNAAFRGRIICTAPKEKQLATRLWPAFRKIAARAGKEYASPLKVDSTKITWHGDDDWCALAETASQPENLAGYHDDYMLFIVDEASGVNEQMFPVIEGAISTGTIVILVLIGNPTKNQGTFFASHMIPKVAKNYFQMHVDLDKTTRVSKEWVQRMVDKYGAASPVVKVRCYGEFADTDEAQLIPYAWLPAAIERDAPEGHIPRLRVAVDVADGGDNFTVATVAQILGDHIHVLRQMKYSFPTSEAPILSAKKAMELFHQYGGRNANGDDLVVDSLGVGAGTAGYLIEQGYNVVTYKGGEASDNKDKWRNRRTQSYITMRDAHRDGYISYEEDFTDDWDDFTAQMCSVRTQPGADRVEDLETKKAMMARGIASPDCADSAAMLFATQAPRTPGKLEVLAMAESTASKGDW